MTEATGNHQAIEGHDSRRGLKARIGARVRAAVLRIDARLQVQDTRGRILQNPTLVFADSDWRQNLATARAVFNVGRLQSASLNEPQTE